MRTLMHRNGGLSLLPELQTVFKDPFLKHWLGDDHNKEQETLPAVNIAETSENYEITVAAPGMTKNDFKVELENNRLVISGEKKQEKEEKEGRAFLRKEFSYTSFVRSFDMGEKQVKGENIKAKYADGVLSITLPKSDHAKTKPARVIPIS